MMRKRTARVRYKKHSDATNIRHLYWILGVVSLITVFILTIVISDYGIYQVYLLNRQKRRLHTNIEKLKTEQDSLLVEKARLENDLDYIEKLARERYRMAKKGEKVFRVIERPPKK
ncbi:MAG: septum formation initiator family protein [Candidatus Marinimicrobia bacterium]|nr:septum formation initiator family protein [Candidatus Neomarinimicrobiota bacterium]